MANLGDKQYNYGFYGLPDRDRVWGTVGVGGYAALTYLNLWGIYQYGDFVTDGVYWNKDDINVSDTFGEPLDTTISLWNINKNSSFACNACFSAETGDTLKPHYDINIHSTDAPLAMCAVDTHGGSSGNFVRSPVGRYAYDISYECNGAYSALIYDIVYNTLCLQPNALIYDRATPTTAPQGRALNAVAAYIDAAPDTRDVCVIRPYMYRGASTPRYRTADGIPPQGLHTTYTGVPLIDTLTDRPIPQTETYLRGLLKDGHDGRRDDVVYNPFAMQLGINLFSTSTTPQTYDIASQLEIGFTRPFSVNALRTGAAQIDSGHRITAQYYRCNYDIKTFSDVVYQWENVIYDTVNGVELQPGFPLTSLSNSTNIRFYTRLRIIDTKGNTKGKALEFAIKHEIAFIGMYFCDSVALSESAELGTAATGVYLPLYSGGVPTGEYVTGDDIPLQPHANAGSIADDYFKYRPEESDSDGGDLTTHLHSGRLSGSTRYYGTSAQYMNVVTQWLNTAYKPSESEFIEDFKGTNPADYIVSLKYYPFDVPIDVEQSEELSIGGVPVTVNGFTPMMNIIPIEYGPGSNSYYDLGSFKMEPPFVYGDFRDTYLKVLLYIPWCGFVTLDASLFAQSPDGTYHNISAGISIDFTTGNALGMVYRDERLIDTINGTVGIDIPMSAVANGSYQNAIKQTEIALKNAKMQQLTAYLGTAGAVVGGIVSASTGNVMGALASAGALAGSIARTEQVNNTIESLKYQLSHTAPAVGDISSASPFNNALSEQTARIFIFKPVMLPGADLDAYAKTTGHACCKQGKLSKISRGYTECAGADMTGINATATEKSMIFAALKSGVII